MQSENAQPLVQMFYSRISRRQQQSIQPSSDPFQDEALQNCRVPKELALATRHQNCNKLEALLVQQVSSALGFKKALNGLLENTSRKK